jgi:hypothetical protein
MAGPHANRENLTVSGLTNRLGHASHNIYQPSAPTVAAQDNPVTSTVPRRLKDHRGGVTLCEQILHPARGDRRPEAIQTPPHIVLVVTNILIQMLAAQACLAAERGAGWDTGNHMEQQQAGTPFSCQAAGDMERVHRRLGEIGGV